MIGGLGTTMPGVWDGAEVVLLLEWQDMRLLFN